MATDLRIPVSAIHGQVQTAGDATHGPFIQLLNSGGLTLFVYELRIAADIGAGTSRIRVRRTTSPMTMGGTTTTGFSERMDPRNASAIGAVLQGCTAIVGTLFTEAVSAWFDRIPGAGAASVRPYPGIILRPQSFPWIVSPGSAIEIANPDASASNFLRAYAVWDEQ